MLPVSYEFVAGLAAEFGAVECSWRESDRSFTGFVAEVWFDQLPADFAVRWARVVEYSVLVRSVSSGPGLFHNQQVAAVDASTNHRIAADPDKEGGGGMGDEVTV